MGLCSYYRAGVDEESYEADKSEGKARDDRVKVEINE